VHLKKKTEKGIAVTGMLNGFKLPGSGSRRFVMMIDVRSLQDAWGAIDRIGGSEAHGKEGLYDIFITRFPRRCLTTGPGISFPRKNWLKNWG